MTEKRIFYVEDDDILRKVLEWRLQKLGYTICGTASTGPDAIAGILETRPDLVILDIELRGHMDGIDVGEYLSEKTTIPFVYLTSHTEDSFLQRAKKTRPKGFITKPIRGEELRVAIDLAF